MFSRRRTIMLALILVLSLALSGCISLGGSDKGKPAPNFTLADLNGNNVSLSDYKGQNVFLNLWASWCAPCTLEMPDIQNIYDEYKDKGLVVLTINQGEEAAAISDFIKKSSYTFPVLVDKERTTAKAYGASSIPMSVFIDKEGKIVSKKVGLMTGEELRQAIGQLK